MPRRKTEEANLHYVECLLYTFHNLAHKTPNSTNSLCGYNIVTGQPSGRLGEDFSENYKDFTERQTEMMRGRFVKHLSWDHASSMELGPHSSHADSALLKML